MEFEKLSTKLYDRLSALEGAVSLYAKFINSNHEYKYNDDKQFWAASIIKIPIALTFYKSFSKKNIALSDRLKIDDDNFVDGSGIMNLLDKGLELTYKDLITLMLVVSDNTAANQIIDFIGWESVGDYMKQLGLKDTKFKHKMMIKAGRGPNLTTAQDIGTLLEKMYNDELPGSREILKIMQEQLDRTRIPLYIPNDIKISYKNGSLAEAMHEVGIVYSRKPFIFSFFSDDQKDKRKTNEVLSTCAKDCFDYSIQE